ncbi:MAG: UDP-N-acetylglucosamine 2-epimerase (non-hydrolyzing) [Crocinitomicaceae bacterium]
MKKIVTIIGARPQIIKAAAISRELKNNFTDEIKEIIVHTGQHYDTNMSDIFFTELGIPHPDYNLNIGSGQHGKQTSGMLEGIETILQKENADLLLIYGDTNSTVAGSLAASKLHIPVAHVEAGLRSFNKSMPEEINRVVADHVSTLLFCPTESALVNLKNEGFSLNIDSKKATIDKPGVYKSGDVMLDNTLYFAQMAEKKRGLLDQTGIESGNFILSTCHRPSNTDNKENINSIFESLLEIAESNRLQVVLPIHPRTQKCFDQWVESKLKDHIRSSAFFKMIPPVSFLEMILLENHCRMIVTDSGGVQKEAFFLNKPCIVLRDETEWVELVENGNAILVGANKNKIKAAYEIMINQNYTYPEYYGDGRAAEDICVLINEFLEK